MDDARIERARRGMEAWNRGDLEGWLAGAAPDVVARAGLSGQLEGTEYHGHEGLRQWWAEYHEAFDEVRLIPDEFHVIDEETLLVLGRVYYRGHASGLEQERPWGWVFQGPGELSRRIDSYDDPGAARAAVGLD